jgi:hypothetical protein
MSNKEDALASHTVLLPGPCPVIIAATKKVAMDAVKSLYGKYWEENGIVVRKTTDRDFEYLKQ